MAGSGDPDASGNRSQIVTGSTPPRVSLLGFNPRREAKHEVLGETAQVALDGLVKSLGRHLVKPGQVSVQHDLLAANETDSPLDEFEGYGQAGLRRGCF